MRSLAVVIVNRLLPLTGVKSFFSDPQKIPAKLAKMRARGPDLPPRSLQREFDITLDNQRGYPVYTLTPKGRNSHGAPHIMYLHGGGYVMDIAKPHWGFVARLCKAIGGSATVPLYPLAPENKAVDVIAAMKDLWTHLADQYGAHNITMMGDSAGGGMTLALAQRLRDVQAPLPARLILLSPWLDATGTDPSQPMIEPKDNLLAIAGLRGAGDMYAGDLSITDPLVSPLFGDHHDLPPIQMFAGTYDILLPDAQRLLAILPDIEYHEYPKMFHVWMLIPVREGRDAMRKMVRFITAR